MAKGKTKASGGEERRRSRASSHILTWMMLAMVVFGLGGYGVLNFSGHTQSIGTVGDQSIDVQDYSRGLRQEINAMGAQLGTPLTMQQALTMGLDQQVLRQLVIAAALDGEASRLGLSVGDARLRDEITGIAAFKGVDGKFDRNSYAFTLKNNGFTEVMFEAKMRGDMTRGILQDALGTGFAPPATLVDTLVGYAGEERGFAMLKLTPADLMAPVPAPDDQALKDFYTAHIANYTSPEAKQITYAALLPEMLVDKAEVDEQALKDLYDQRKADFVKPERRLVERLVYPTEAEAAAAKARLDAGTATFEDLVKERGLALSDIDLGDITRDDLAPAAADGVFGLAAPGVVGPLASKFGPALFRMNGILAAQTTTFEQARDELAAEAKRDRATRMIADQVEDINDRLAGGATVQDLAKETDMQLGQIDVTSASNEGMAAYKAFREAVQKVTADDFPEVIQLDDGGIVAIHLDGIKPATPIPFEQVADKVRADWTAAETMKALQTYAETVKAAVVGGKELSAFGVTDVVSPMRRSGTAGEAPAALVAEVFKLDPGGVAVVPGTDAVWVAQLKDIEPANPEDPDVKAARARIGAQAAQGIANDAFDAFATELETEAGIKLDQAAINAVNAQFH